jgi:hypothetical protein
MGELFNIFKSLGRDTAKQNDLRNNIAPEIIRCVISTVFYYRDRLANTHFLTISSNISNIKLFNDIYFRFTPQFYYLDQDGKDGVYLTSAFTLSKLRFPLSIQSIINKTIQTEVPGSENFVWNISLIYSFNKKYVEP